MTKNRRRVVERRFHSQAADEVSSQDANANNETADASRLVLSLVDQEVALDDSVRDFVVGRHSESDLRANSKTVSRHHLKISWEEGRFVVTDQSSNGTYLRAPDGDVQHLHGESIPLEGEGVMFLGLPPDDPTAVQVEFTVS